MLRIDNFYFVKFDELSCSPAVNPATCEQPFKILGICHNHPFFPDNTYITTSPVEIVKDGYAQTQSGSVYKLGTPNKDYAEYLMALRDNFPIFTSWSLSGNLGEYCITGVMNGKSARGYIASQEGNFITLESGLQCLVLWRNGIKFDYLVGAANGRFLDMKYPDDFEINMDYICRPKLFR